MTVELLPAMKICDIHSVVSQDAIIGCVVLSVSMGVIVALVFCVLVNNDMQSAGCGKR